MDVEAALTLLLESRSVPTFDAVRDLVRSGACVVVPTLSQPRLDFQVYDALLTARCAHA
jgi:hypothetical protein